MRADRNSEGLDRLIIGFDRLLKGAFGTHRSRRADHIRDFGEAPDLTTAERRVSAGLIRVDHAGEVCAQALYEGQAITARNPAVAAHMRQSAVEEREHLDWCEQRLDELNSTPTRLAPVWYAGSFVVGLAAGLSGDRNSLGFVAATEREVDEHLERHLTRLPERDTRSREILLAMQADERRHGTNAIGSGGREFPGFIRKLMRAASTLMTATAPHI